MDNLAYNIDDFLTTLYSQISQSLLILLTKLDVKRATAYILCNSPGPSTIHACRKIQMTPSGLSVDFYDPPIVLSQKYPKLTSIHRLSLPTYGISTENMSYAACSIRTFKGYVAVIVCEKTSSDKTWGFDDLSSLIDSSHEMQEPIERLVALLDLKSKTNRLQFILANMRDVVMIYSKEGFITYISENVSRHSDYKAEELIGKHCSELIHPDQMATAIEKLADLSQGITEAYHDYLIKFKDDSYNSWRMRCQPIMKDGKLEEVVSVIANIDAEKKVEDRLADSEKKYRLLAENASDIIFTMDTNLRFTYISPSVTRMRGWTVEEAMNQPLNEALTPESLEYANNKFREALEMAENGEISSETVITLELEEICKDGSTIWTETTFSGVFNEKGKMTGILGITRDINTRKLAQKKIAQTKLTKNFIMNNIQDIIMVTDTKGVITYVTPNVIEHIDYTADELIGQSAYDIMHPDYRESLKKARDGYPKGIPARSQEYKIRRKEGTYSWYRLNSQPIVVDGKFEQVISIVYNIDDEMKEREQDLARQKNYRLLAENIADMVVTYDVKTMKPYFISSSCMKFFGRSREELESILEHTSPEAYARIMTNDSLEVVLRFINDRLDDIKNSTIDYKAQTLLDLEFINVDGKPVRFETSVSFIATPDGPSILTVSRNISARNTIFVEGKKNSSVKRLENEKKSSRSLKQRRI